MTAPLSPRPEAAERLSRLTRSMPSVSATHLVAGMQKVTSTVMAHQVLSTGECLTRPELRLPVYRTWVAGGVVYVDVNAPVLASA